MSDADSIAYIKSSPSAYAIMEKVGNKEYSKLKRYDCPKEGTCYRIECYGSEAHPTCYKTEVPRSEYEDYHSDFIKFD